MSEITDEMKGVVGALIFDALRTQYEENRNFWDDAKDVLENVDCKALAAAALAHFAQDIAAV